MNRKVRFAYLTLVFVLIFSIFSVPVFADEEDVEVKPQVETAAPAEDITPQVPATQKPTSAPEYKPESKTSKSSKTSTAKSYSTDSKTSTYSSGSSKTSTSSRSTWTSKSKTSYTPSKSAVTFQSRSTASSKTDYISRSQSVASTKAATSPVYDAKEKIDNKDILDNKDWKSITAQLKNATKEDDAGNAADSFDWIKNNDSSSDNGIWILALGIGLEALALIIIILLIVFAVRRKKAGKSNDSESEYFEDDDDDFRPTPPGQGGTRGRRVAPQRVQPRSSSPRQVRKRSKFDTDEVYIPKEAQRSGGRRYKPRH